MNIKKKIFVGFLVAICTWLMSFNVSYTMLDYKPVEGDTLWGVLGEEVFNGNYGQANKSLRYMEWLWSDDFDPDYLQGNTNTRFRNGDEVRVRDGQLSIIQSNLEYRLPPIDLLPSKDIWSHNLQLFVYNLLILILGVTAYFFYDEKRKDFIDSLKIYIKPFTVLFIVFLSLLMWFVNIFIYEFIVGFGYNNFLLFIFFILLLYTLLIKYIKSLNVVDYMYLKIFLISFWIFSSLVVQFLLIRSLVGFIYNVNGEFQLRSSNFLIFTTPALLFFVFWIIFHLGYMYRKNASKDYLVLGGTYIVWLMAYSLILVY